ncbi:MAG TPA: N-terminal phage integrase SAM-like domain-containing protein [Ktedonobacteraceae bacterium]|nr:N-terminal phage integrase SAM-like domain-containing protein [Ktedonobacteraceae bacterium]
MDKSKSSVFDTQHTLLLLNSCSLMHYKHSVRPRTYERYEAMIRLHLVPGLGHHPLQKLSPQHLQSFYTKKLDEGLSPTTVTSFHKMLHWPWIRPSSGGWCLEMSVMR